MPRLPDGWTEMKGISCAGWDITSAFNLSRPEGSRFAVFRRRISAQEHLDQGRLYPTAIAVVTAIDDIRRVLMEGRYQFEDLFPEERLITHPNYGAF
jgi:hypothetical protein